MSAATARDPIHAWRTVEYLGIDWPAQAVHVDLDAAQAERAARAPAGALAVADATGRSTPAQLVRNGDRVEAWYVASLGAGETQDYQLVSTSTSTSTDAGNVGMRIEPEALEWSASNFGLRLAWRSAEVRHAAPIPLSHLPGPIQAVRGPDGIWFGRGYWQSQALCSAWRCEVVEAGPVVWRFRCTYALVGDAILELEYRLDAATPAVEVAVRCSAAVRASLVWEPRQAGRFEPERAFWRPHSPSAWHGAKGAWNRQVYDLRWPAAPDMIALTAFYNWNADSAMFWSCWSARPERCDLLVAGAIRPSRTRCPEPYQPLTVSAWSEAGSSRLAFAAPAQAGRKLFFLAVLDRRVALPQADQAGCGAERLYRQMQCLGLDEYQHMCLDWSGMDRQAHPRLMIEPSELPGVRQAFQDWDWLRERFEAHAEDRLFLTHDQPDMLIRPEARTLGSDWAGAYLVSGREEYARRAKALIDGRLDTWVRQFAALGPTEDSLIGIGLARLWRATCIAFDLVAGSPAFTDAERAGFLRRFAFITEVSSTDDAWPPPETGLGRGNPNFHADFLTAKGIAAALLTGHPKQAEWLDRAAGEAIHYLNEYHFSSGCSDEAATYQFVSLSCMTLFSIALRHAGRDGLYERGPAMKRSFDYLAASQTPRDPRTGFCMLPTIGHVTGYGWCQSLQACFAWAAKATASSDPAFSQRMMAAWRRAGSMPISLHEFHSDLIWWQPACLIDRRLPDGPDAGQARSRAHHGLGAIFRASHPEGEQGYLLVKMGPSRGHFDPDEGSLFWYAYGRPVLADFGCQYNPNIECAWLHNRVSFDRWNETWGHAFQVRAASLGRHVDFIAGDMTVRSLYTWGDWPVRRAEFDFRLSARRRDIEPLTWQRSVAYVRECEAIVVCDALDGRLPTDWNLQVLAEEARLGAASARFTGQFGVDLDVHFAQPAAPDLAISSFEHLGFDEPRLPFYWWRAVQWAAPDGARYGPFAERALTLRARAAPGQGYLALLLARPAGRPPAEVEALPDGGGFAWSSGEAAWRVERQPAGVWRAARVGDGGRLLWSEDIGGV